ncbi:hypothetical protein GGR42_000306 [Saonia flava]|uniref:DM13 domain-containing protein n=1 Tax=Saonia flava TaxID=523696 RepID=A0A846QXL3_9FLAO|nr:DM13 domain-containing protein [Saonia flava]NJB69844.1 hypothetical protein [Saonia flava]
MKYVYLLSVLLVFLVSCSSTDIKEEEEMAIIEEEEMEMVMEEEEEEMMEEDMMEEEEESSMALMGEFMDGAHPTSGSVTINEDMTLLTLTNFKSDDGPSLELYIASNTNADEYVSLGGLQGLEGDFTYELPNTIDFGTHNVIMVWCVPFSVNFGYAVLE